MKLPAAVKYAFGVRRNEFYFTSSAAADGARYFTMCDSTLFHIRRKANISPTLLTNGDVCVILSFARLRMSDRLEVCIPMGADISSVLFIRCSEFDRLHLVPLWAR